MIVVIASRKGGSGKSTIACNMAAMLSVENRKVVLVDTDPQATAMNWANTRAERSDVKSVPAIPARHGKHILQTIKDLDTVYEYVLVDLQGMDSEQNRYLLTLADRVILPFKPSQPDLDTIPYMSDMLGQLKEVNETVEPFYVINEAPTTTGKEKREALEYFANFQITPIPTIIHARKAYRDAMAFGLSASELADEKAKSEFFAAYRDIFH